jgi:hypothetical protein
VHADDWFQDIRALRHQKLNLPNACPVTPLNLTSGALGDVTQPSSTNAATKQARKWDAGCMRPNENKMSDGAPERASLGLSVWKLCQNVARTTVRRSLHRMVRLIGPML